MRAAQHLGGAGAAECEQRCRWRAYSKANESEADGAVVLIVLLCCLICAVALNAAIRCFLRGGGEQERNDHDSKAGAWRLAVARTVEYREGMEAECAICLSEFEEGEAVHVLETCKHAFHVDCIEKWFRSRPSCPTCRCSCRPPPESDPELGINPAHQMWFASVRSGLGGGGSVASIGGALVRHFSRKRAVNTRKINPKVPHQQAYSIAEDLYGIVKQHGPINNANAWNLIKDSNIVTSKTHMKIMFKWMRGRRMLKLLCNRVGTNKKFLHCTLPEDPQNNEPESQPEVKVQPKKPSKKDRMQSHKRLL